MISYFLTVIYEYVSLIFVERFLYAERFLASKSAKNDEAHFETKGGFQYIQYANILRYFVRELATHNAVL